MSHDALTLSVPTGAPRFRAPAAEAPAANAAAAPIAAFAPDAYVAARRPEGRRPCPPPAPASTDVAVIRAEMKVLQAELAAMNARIERLLAMIPPAAEPADAPTDDEVATGDEVATDDDVAPAEAPAAAEPTDDEAAAPAFDQAYQIQWGDTLTGLAQAFGTTVEAIAEANEIADPDMIYAGDTLMVPAAPAEGTFDAATLAAPAPTAPVPPAAPALPPIPVPGA